MRKAERSVSKQAQLQPRLHSWPGNLAHNCKMAYSRYLSEKSSRTILKLVNYSCSSYPTRASYSGQVDEFRNPMKNELKTRPCLKPVFKVTSQKKNLPMNFYETFPECSLPSTVSKNRIKMIGHHSRLRAVISQSYPI